METPQSKYRFSEETLAQIDALCDLLGMPARADVLRYAVSRLYKQELKDEKKRLRKSETPS